jgi:hypothetical protein
MPRAWQPLCRRRIDDAEVHCVEKSPLNLAWMEVQFGCLNVVSLWCPTIR